MLPGTPSRDEVIDGFVDILVNEGALAVPEAYRQATIDEAWRRLSDPVTGFWWFWLNLAWLHIKGRGHGKGWQRACPGSKPREIDNGRDWGWQSSIAKVLPLHEIILFLKARQIGFTYIVANMVEWAALAEKEQIIAVIANKLQSSKRLVRRTIQVHKHMPDWVKDRVDITGPYVTRLEYSNGSVVEPYSGDPDAVRSDSASWVFVDEIGEIKKLLDFFGSVESVADGGGRLVMFGTAKDNGLEEWVRQCAAGDEVDMVHIEYNNGDVERLPVMRQEDGDMTFVFVPDRVHPERTDEWRARRRRTYRGNLRNFDREHPQTWQEAFIAQGAGYFDNAALEAQTFAASALFEERDRRGTLLPDGHGSYRFVEDPFGHVVFHASAAEIEEILKARRPCVIGGDCAGSSTTGGDYHSGHLLLVGRVPEPGDDTFDEADIVPHVQLATIHGRMDSDHYAELLVRLGIMFGNCLVAPEVNGVGVAVVQAVRRMKYRALFVRRERPDKRGGKMKRQYGWYTGGGTDGTKHTAYGELERCFRNGWIEIRDVETLAEMKNVLHLGGGRIGAPEPKHDDRPDGLSIAVAVVQYARSYTGSSSTNVSAMPAPEFGSLEWLNQRIDERLARERRSGIGHENRNILAG